MKVEKRYIGNSCIRSYLTSTEIKNVVVPISHAHGNKTNKLSFDTAVADNMARPVVIVYLNILSVPCYGAADILRMSPER